MGVPGFAWAEDLAIIVANEFYNGYPRVSESRNVQSLEGQFRQAGFAVEVVRNTRTTASSGNSEALWRRIDAADRLVVVLSGHVVEGFGEPWLVHTDAGPLSAFTLGRDALPLGPFFEMAAARQGDAVIAIGQARTPISTGSGVVQGYTGKDIPQGVTVIVGGPSQMANFVGSVIVQPGKVIGEAAARAPVGLAVLGYVPRSQAFIAQGASPDLMAQIQEAAWITAQQQNTVEAYRDYYTRFPDGPYVEDARAREAELQLTPSDRARIGEANLNLSRDQRRAIQRQLTLLGFDTRGVDGVFGRNSRNAIFAWQQNIGEPNYGFLTASHVTRIEAAAAVRAEQLRLEEERQRQIAEQQDRLYWNQTGASGNAAGLRAYLEKYPDGVYSQTAWSQLRAIEREQRRQADAADRQAWDQAVMGGGAQHYEAYLNQFPNGKFVAEAKARLDRLYNPEIAPEVIQAAQAEERRLNLNSFTRRLIEAQLRTLDLNPGRVDGNFTEETRRALRNYQRSSNLPATGYVTRNTVVRLLASAVE